MSSQQQPTSRHPGPVATFRDSAVFSKVWRNWSKDGEPFYSITFGRTYTDKATGKLKESQSFSPSDSLKLQVLAPKAYESAAQFRDLDKSVERSRAAQAEQRPEQVEAVQQALPVSPEPQTEPDRAVEQPQSVSMAEKRDSVMEQASPNQTSPAHGPDYGREL